MELKRKLIQDQQDQIQILKSAVNETREEKLQLSSDMQKRQQLEEQCVEFTTEIQALTRDIRVCVTASGHVVCFCCCCQFVLFFNSLAHFLPNQEAKEQLSPLSAALEKLQQEKQELVDRWRQRQDEGQEKVVDTGSFKLLLTAIKVCKNAETAGVSVPRSLRVVQDSPFIPSRQTVTFHNSQPVCVPNKSSLNIHNFPVLAVYSVKAVYLNQ